MIKEINKSELNKCLEVIHSAYIPIAARFGLTDENCPDSGRATLKYDKFLAEYSNGEIMFAYYLHEKIVGYIGMRYQDSIIKIDDIVVVPAYQFRGIGTELIEFCIKYAIEHACTKIRLGMINDNAELRKWYEKNGFETIELKQYPNAPIITGYMEQKI